MLLEGEGESEAGGTSSNNEDLCGLGQRHCERRGEEGGGRRRTYTGGALTDFGRVTQVADRGGCFSEEADASGSNTEPLRILSMACGGASEADDVTTPRDKLAAAPGAQTQSAGIPTSALVVWRCVHRLLFEVG